MDRTIFRVLMRLAGVLACLIPLVLVAGTAPSQAVIGDGGWVHDHTSTGIPPRPSGYTEMVSTYGDRCIDRSNDGRTLWPSQSDVGVAGYVYFHAYLQRVEGWNVRNHVDAAGKNRSTYPGIGGYNCRLISGSTSWSVHSWGAAIDTNWLRNPMGQTFWNGHGSDDKPYGTYLPDVWRGPFPGHNFYWGINWTSRPDPMHFQYVTNY